MYWKLVFLPNKKPVFSKNYKNIKCRNFRYLRHFSSFIQRKNMRPIFSKYCMFILLVFCFFNCKTYQNVDWIKPKLPKEERSVSFEPKQISRIKEGDSLMVIASNSKKYYLIYSESVNDSIQGLFWKFENQTFEFPRSRRIAFSEIEELRVRKFNLGTTLGVGIGVPVMSLVIYWGVIVHQAVSDLEDYLDDN